MEYLLVWFLSHLSQVFNATQEMALSTKYPYIRLFTAKLVSSAVPVEELLGVQQVWAVPNPST